jgi:hypothetical protein
MSPQKWRRSRRESHSAQCNLALSTEFAWLVGLRATDLRLDQAFPRAIHLFLPDGGGGYSLKLFARATLFSGKFHFSLIVGL